MSSSSDEDGDGVDLPPDADHWQAGNVLDLVQFPEASDDECEGTAEGEEGVPRVVYDVFEEVQDGEEGEEEGDGAEGEEDVREVRQPTTEAWATAGSADLVRNGVSGTVPSEGSKVVWVRGSATARPRTARVEPGDYFYGGKGAPTENCD
ncbi:hypothetical protein BDK51DRAFT_33476 [Blyttiomyces helicus]|uniref:Uncharacterized protein n=1 Tax=Blyttiomyces helicus TaxID=388810 RepID=A0A4P9W3P5_9FUNG|nr:hypothetical protein BDK51DRAFT_33476 [Blyttiomyces helicus]|eukprot:RKO86951.1 hypothetical protein BDK51DRAFT_33476 [Blyttiomyces helicus]